MVNSHRPRTIQSLPTVTSRDNKYTHNDHKHLILHHHSGPTRIRLIPQSRHQSLEVVGDPPTPRHSVADPHAVATLIHGGRSGPPHPTTRSFWAYDVYSHTKAFYFGNKILRMAGIVQMLHSLQTPYDKYPYAHRERTFKARRLRTQTGSSSSMAS